MLYAKFGLFGEAVSEEKIFQKLTNQEQETPVAAMFVIGLGGNEQSVQMTFHRYFLPSSGRIVPLFQPIYFYTHMS